MLMPELKDHWHHLLEEKMVVGVMFLIKNKMIFRGMQMVNTEEYINDSVLCSVQLTNNY